MKVGKLEEKLNALEGAAAGRLRHYDAMRERLLTRSPSVGGWLDQGQARPCPHQVIKLFNRPFGSPGVYCIQDARMGEAVMRLADEVVTKRLAELGQPVDAESILADPVSFLIIDCALALKTLLESGNGSDFIEHRGERISFAFYFSVLAGKVTPGCKDDCPAITPRTHGKNASKLRAAWDSYCDARFGGRGRHPKPEPAPSWVDMTAAKYD